MALLGQPSAQVMSAAARLHADEAEPELSREAQQTRPISPKRRPHDRLHRRKRTEPQAHRCRTWAPPGKTPTLEFNFNWTRLSAAAGLTFRDFYFRLYDKAIAAAEAIDFLQALVRHLDAPLLVVWDRLPAHRSGLVQEFIRYSEGRLETAYLPAYAPELDPVEYICVSINGIFCGSQQLGISSSLPAAPPESASRSPVSSMQRETAWSSSAAHSASSRRALKRCQGRLPAAPTSPGARIARSSSRIR